MPYPLLKRHPKCLKTLVRTCHAGRSRTVLCRKVGASASDRSQRLLGIQKK